LTHDGGTTADAGTFSIADDASLEIANPVASTEAVQFDSSNGVLKLDAPSSFAGLISGFTGDGTLAGSDQIDLKGIDYNSTSFTKSFDAGTDTLSVSDGTQSATLHFSGSYQAANFSFQSDGHGGTIVYDPPVSDSPDWQAGATLANAASGSLTVASSSGFVFNFAGPSPSAATDFHSILDHSGGMLLPNAPVGPNTTTELHSALDQSGGMWLGSSHTDIIASTSLPQAQLHADGFHVV
jgi:hypothetical protein